MPSGAGKERGNAAGVLDAGIVLARLETVHRGSAAARALLERGRRGALSLSISAVNLTEVLRHSRRFREASGTDVTALLDSCRVGVHAPDAATAAVAAGLDPGEPVSLADRFAAATAKVLGARLHTTDAALARLVSRLGIPVTRY